MLKSQDKQKSFFDTDYICEELIPPDSFYRKFREAVWPLVKDEQFSDMYCTDNGRPPIPPSLLAMATVLQFHNNLSDREMERACMYNIEVKYALGLKLNERPFDHSSLGDFRRRLLENGKEKEVFDNILGKLIEDGLIEKNEIQRIDATHIIADIAIPTMVTLVKKGIYEVLKPLQKRHKKTLNVLDKEVELANYNKKQINHDAPGRLDMEKRKQKLVDVVTDAQRVLKHTEGIEDDHILTRRVEMLKRILQENIEEDENGTSREIGRKKKPKDIMVSPIDPDARYGAKSRTKKFTGYKTNITETTNNRFITNIKAMRGNKRDGDTAIDAITEQQKHGLNPAKLIGDTAYSDGAYRKALKEVGTEIVAPLRENNERTKSIFPKSMFHYEEEQATLTCPAGVTIKQSFYNKKKKTKIFHFPMSQCNKCNYQRSCTNAREGRRTVGITQVHKELREAEVYNKTDQFKEEMKLRPPIEGKLSELTRYHGLRRARYRGLRKVGLQCYFTATAVNIKRWIKLTTEQMKPKLASEAVC
jgi:transposase